MIYQVGEGNKLKAKLGSLEKKIIGFTNGCFDIIHLGHVRYLDLCKEHCDILVLGLNTDNSVKKQKGIERPINNFYSRGEVLSHLRSIDYIIGFEEITPLNLIKLIRPNILFKGADYEIDNVVGSSFLKQIGGTTKLIKYEDGYSTTKIIEKIKKLQ